MSFMVKMIIAAWGTVFVMIGFCALNESGKLLKIHARLGGWLRTIAPKSVVSGLAGSAASSERELAA